MGTYEAICAGQASPQSAMPKGHMNAAVLGSNVIVERSREPPVLLVLGELDGLMKELYDEVDKLGSALSPVMRPAVPEPMPGPGEDHPQSPLHESLLGVRDRVRFNLAGLRTLRSRLTI